MKTPNRSTPFPGLVRSLTLLALATTLLAGGAATARAGNLKWTITPYAWATDVGVDVKLDGRQVMDETIPVGDLLQDLDTIVQLRLEAQYKAHGVMLDLFDVTLSDQERGVALPRGAGSADLDSDGGMTILDLAGIYDPRGDRQGVAFLYGTRILNERATVDGVFRLNAGPTLNESWDTNETYVDALVGVRFSKRFSRSWTWQMQADVSAGGTDYTWSTNPSLTYAFGTTGRYAINAGWRHMHVDFEDGNGVEPAMSLSGALLGLRLSF